MTIFDQDGNEITWEEFGIQLRDAVALAQEHDEEIWVRPDIAKRLNAEDDECDCDGCA